MVDTWLIYLVGGFNPSEEYEFVSWDNKIPNRQIKNVPNHQPVADGVLLGYINQLFPI